MNIDTCREADGAEKSVETPKTQEIIFPINSRYAEFPRCNAIVLQPATRTDSAQSPAGVLSTVRVSFVTIYLNESPQQRIVTNKL